jgi:hypothetical protein
MKRSCSWHLPQLSPLGMISGVLVGVDNGDPFLRRHRNIGKNPRKIRPGVDILNHRPSTIPRHPMSDSGPVERITDRGTQILPSKCHIA